MTRYGFAASRQLTSGATARAVCVAQPGMPRDLALASPGHPGEPPHPASRQDRAGVPLRSSTSGEPDSAETLFDLAVERAAQGCYDEVVGLARRAACLVPDALACLDLVSQVRSLIPVSERAWSEVCDLEVRTLIGVGDLPRARSRCQRLQALVEARATASLGDQKEQRALSVVHERLGDLARLAGDVVAAGTEYRTCLAIREGLAAAAPADLGLSRDLSVVHERLGDLAHLTGDFDTASSRYRAALRITASLVRVDPANPEWQRDLVVICERLAHLGHPNGVGGSASEQAMSSDDRQRGLLKAGRFDTEVSRAGQEP